MPNPIPFTPVALRVRHDGWTADRQRGFVAALAETRHVGRAAAVGMTPKSAYRLRDRPDAGEFARAWDHALEFVPPPPDIRIARAIDGVAEPIFHGGLQVGERRRYDDAKLLQLLRGAMRRDRG